MSKKYNRTYHFSFSEGATSDDRIQFDISNLLNTEIVITEKLDGSNSCIAKQGYYGRSHAEITRNPWDIKLIELWNNINQYIPNDIQLFGESMYAIHSIEYKKLDSHFYLFGVRESENKWLSWSEIEEYAYLLDLKTVPVLFKGIVKTENELRSLINSLMSESKFDGDIEGVVCRVSDSFEDKDFTLKCLKLVRKSHVKTDIHWQKNWRKANINY
jgi:ATP-dependent RNA circularization protein (DNA/RNA ligase family)